MEGLTPGDESRARAEDPAEPRRDGLLQHEIVATNGVRLHVPVSGPRDGTAVVLLHGFPEFWYGWRHQIGPLAAAGFRVIAPDQRGYGGSDKPEPVAAYALDTIAADIAGLIQSTGRSRALLVGHDWGGIVAWWVAARYPERVERLVAINAPHPLAFRRYLRRSARQLVKSWYTFYFQLPWLPEALFRHHQWRRLAGSLVASSRPGTFAETDLQHYRAAWSEPRAIRTMIHWYRAAVRYPPAPMIEDARIPIPTLVIWGVQDRFLEAGLARASLELCDRGKLELIEDATHWVHHEEPARVNRMLVAFLTGEGSA